MALWGNQDNLVGADYSPAAPDSVIVVGTASSDFWTAEGTSFVGVPTGTAILLGAEAGEDGFLVIESLLSDDLARCGKMSAVSAGTYDAKYSTQPISLKNDPAYAESAANIVTGISSIRTQVIAGISTAGIDALEPTGTAGTSTTLAGGLHAGWVGIMTYVDMHGELRTKTETFVAASGIQTGNRPYPV
jgi:hypothetical protein